MASIPETGPGVGMGVGIMMHPMQGSTTSPQMMQQMQMQQQQLQMQQMQRLQMQQQLPTIMSQGALCMGPSRPSSVISDTM